MTRALRSALLLSFAIAASSVSAQNPRVWLDTDLGPIILELDATLAPNTTGNFLTYVNEGFYDGLVFHRTIEDFVIQGGGFDREFVHRAPTHPAILSEAGNGLLNEPGAIAMALAGGNVNSAQAQFYINTAVNDFLDGDFTVFGHVVSGSNTVTAIEQLRTGVKSLSNGTFSDAPVSPPAIRRAVEIDGEGFPLMPLHTASWFDSANPGVGFNVEIANDASSGDGPLLIVYWYDFGEDRQIWMIGIAAFEYGATEVTLDMLIHPGIGDGVGFLMPPPVGEFEQWGTLTVRFNDCSSGQFSYSSPTHGEGSVSVSRLTLADGADCS
ncbi:MAG: hypothetical protein HND55_12140 [Pseudomonadota bacterium]|nr:MAG: hypothetical protein HND55_12140 [Pseudomonadota bacterium]